MRSVIPPVDRSLNPQSGTLKGSKLNTPETLEAFSQRFDGGMKKVFSNNQAPQYIKLGSTKDIDSKRGIKAGRLTLTG